MLVHLQSSEILKAYVTRPVTFDDAIVRRVEAASLQAGWNSNPAPLWMRSIGDEWVARADSAVLQVPSAIIERESNFLLNPAHPEFARITLGAEERFDFDPRLLKS